MRGSLRHLCDEFSANIHDLKNNVKVAERFQDFEFVDKHAAISDVLVDMKVKVAKLKLISDIAEERWQRVRGNLQGQHRWYGQHVSCRVRPNGCPSA